jgi:hypothetical protein
VRRTLVSIAITLGLASSLIATPPAVAVGNTLYVAPSGSVGAGTSCASPGYVGGSSIGTAITAAADGDTVLLCDGTFNVNSQIFINNKEITISGQTSAANTIINGSGSNNGIFKIISTKSVKLEKINFYQGHSAGYGGAIEMSMKPAESLSTTRHVITNNYFVQNTSDDQGGAIFGGGDNMGTGDFRGILTISNNLFIENYAAVDGGAIVMAAVAFDETRIVIDSNKFIYNRAGGRAGGAVVSNFNTLTTQDNVFYLNTTGDTGNSETLYGRIKMGGDLIMNNLSSGRRDCRLENLSPTVARTTRVDNPYCLLFDDSQVPGLTTVTRAQGLALSGNFIPQSPLVSSSTVSGSSATLSLSGRDSGGSTITQYSYSLNGGTYVNFAAGNSSSQTITGLTPSTNYTVRLRATSAAGTSYPSSSYSFTTGASAADAPVISNVTAGDLSITVAFTLGADNGSAINDVYYSLNGGGYVSSGSTASPISISSLNGRTSYSVRIKSQNAGGLSSASNLMSATTLDSAQDAADAATLVESTKRAERERQSKIEAARARILFDVQAGKVPEKADLIEAEYPAVVEATVPKMMESIPIFSRAESTTAQDLLIAAKSVEIVQKLSNELQAKRVTTRDLSSIGIQLFAGDFKTQILRGLIEVPVSERDTLKEIKFVAESLLMEIKARRERLAAIITKISNRG